MSQKLYTYSLVKALYDRKSDYIDAFSPFAVNSIPDGQRLSVQEVQERILARFGIVIPIHSLETIIKRAKRSGYVTVENRKYALTAKGKSHQVERETEREVQRRINELVEDASEYLAEEHREFADRSNVYSMIQAVVAKNLDLFDAYLGGAQPKEGATANRALTPSEAAVVDYFQHVEESKPQIFGTLRDLIAGSILTAALNSDSVGASERGFGRTNLYLDTNFAFSVLGLDSEEANQPATELVQLLRASGAFRLYVFDFTVDEMVSLLKVYRREYARYIPGVRVNSIFSSLRTKGWTPSKTTEFIATLDQKLAEKGIAVLTTNIRLDEFVAPLPDDVTKLHQYKPDQPAIGQNHDLAAVGLIAKLRGKEVRRVEDARELFLTSDFRLAKYAIFGRGHEARGTVSEVIPDRVLTNIIWLKSPNLLSEIPLNTIISMHSRDLVIDRDVWSRFYAIVQSLKKEGRLEQYQIDALLYDRHVLDYLRVLDAQQINEETVFSRVESAVDGIELEKQLVREGERRRLQARHDAEMAQGRMDAERIDQYLQSTARHLDVHRQLNARIVQEVRNTRTALRVSSQTWARRSRKMLQVTLLLLLAIVLWFMVPPIVEKYDEYEAAIWIATATFWGVIAVLNVRLDPQRFWKFIDDAVAKAIYRVRGGPFERLSLSVDSAATGGGAEIVGLPDSAIDAPTS